MLLNSPVSILNSPVIHLSQLFNFLSKQIK